MSIRFTRIWDASSAVQVHVSEGVKYLILPVLDGSSIVGFTVYDLIAGELEELTYRTLHDAKAAVEKFEEAA